MKNVDGLGSSARFRAALAAQIPGVLYLVLRGAFGRVGQVACIPLRREYGDGLEGR